MVGTGNIELPAAGLAVKCDVTMTGVGVVVVATREEQQHEDQTSMRKSDGRNLTHPDDVDWNAGLAKEDIRAQVELM